VRDREIEWAELMLSANAGDGGAYHRLLAGIAPVLRATTESALEQARYQANQCESIVQEILLAVHLKRHTWDARAPFCSWLLAITRKKLSDAMRRTAEPAHIDIDCFRRPSLEESPSEPRNVSEAVEHVQSLPQRQRIVLQAIISKHVLPRELATELMMTENAVLVALHRGLSELASKMRNAGANRLK
jgi:RNA polymerase sigma-70 factor (ECF subfamily)